MTTTVPKLSILFRTTRMQASVTGASQTQTAFSYNELTPAPPAGSTIIYMGAMGKAIQMLKRVSIMSLASAWAATPLFAYTAMTGIGSGSGGASTNAAIVVMTGGIVLSSLSTSVIQWACKPYVTAIASTSRATQSNTINPNEQQLAITRIGLFGTPYTVTIAASDLRPAKGRLFATWQTNAKTEELLEQKGRKNAKRDFFFVHADSVENDSEAGRLIDEVVKREADLVLAGVESIAEAAANNLAGSQLKEDWDQIEQLIDSDDVSPETASKISDLLDSLRASMLDVRRQIFSAVSADVNSSKEKNKAAEGLLVSEEILALKAAKLKLEQKLASHKILLTNLYAQLDSQLSTSSRLLDRSIHSEAAKQSIEDLVKAQNALVLAISNSKNVENSIINNNDQSPLPNTSNISPTSALESNELITTSVLEIDDDSDLEGDLDEEIDPEDPGASSAGSDELVQTNETVSRAQSVTTAESITGIEHITTLNLPDIILADGDADATSDIVGDSGIGGTLLNDFANDLMFSEPGFDFNNNGGGETNSVDDIVNGFDLGGFMDNNLQTHRKENGEVNTPDPTKDPNQLNQLDEDTIDLSLDDF